MNDHADVSVRFKNLVEKDGIPLDLPFQLTWSSFFRDSIITICHREIYPRLFDTGTCLDLRRERNESSSTPSPVILHTFNARSQAIANHPCRAAVGFCSSSYLFRCAILDSTAKDESRQLIFVADRGFVHARSGHSESRRCKLPRTGLANSAVSL